MMHWWKKTLCDVATISTNFPAGCYPQKKMNKKWTMDKMPSQEGKTALVTGANSGLGYYAVLGLARKGARVVMACRNLEKGEKARERITEAVPGNRPALMKLDLADLASVREFAENFRAEYSHLDLLINNAGLMAIPYRKTADGFEMQFGVNHLGHFALTGLLWPLLEAAPGSRVVNVSSSAHRMGEIAFDDLHWDNRTYRRWKAYGMSKLANILFTRELVRRLDGADKGVTVAAAHPGYAASNLLAKGSEMQGKRFGQRMAAVVNGVFAQSTEMGTLPILYAATEQDVEQGAYYGPGGFARMYGYPVRETPDPRRDDPEVARRLWDVSQELTGISYL